MRSLLLVSGALALPVFAQQELDLPDWSRSTLACPPTVRERDLLPCTLTLRRGAKRNRPLRHAPRHRGPYPRAILRQLRSPGVVSR